MDEAGSFRNMPIKENQAFAVGKRKNPEHTAQACANLKALQRCKKPTEESLNLELTSCPENCAWMTQVSTDEDNLLNKNFRLHVLLRCSAPAPAAHRSEHRTGHAPIRGEPGHHARCCRHGGGVPEGPQRGTQCFLPSGFSIGKNSATESKTRALEGTSACRVPNRRAQTKHRCT